MKTPAIGSAIKLAFLGLILAACCPAQSPASADKGTVSGIVTNAAGDPLRRVTVQLTPLPAGPGSHMDAPVSNAATETDSQGNFTFDDVAPGRYMLAAERTGYLTTRYGNPRGGPLTTSPRQGTTGIVIRMVPQGIIAGKVFDDENEPLPGATVNVRLHSLPSRPAQVAPLGAPLEVATGTTNADGAFAIGSLNPGRYVVSVAHRPNTGPPVKSPSLGSHPEAYVTTYYPDATELADASPVELSAGAEVRGLEIRLQRVPIFKVSGKVLNAVTGAPGPADAINIFRQGSGTPGVSARSTGLNAGEFSFDGVLPGNYILETKPTVGAEDRTAWVGRQIVSVGSEDLDRVVVEMKPAIELRGKVIAEGTPVSSWPQVTLTPEEGLNYPDFAAIDEDGRFRLAGLEPAPYRLNIGLTPPPTFVKSVRFNGHDLAGEPIDLAAAPTAFLEIVISDRASSSIGGVVSDVGRLVGPGITVVAMPSGTRGRVTQTDENGRFSIAGLPPGEYRLIAMDSGGGFPILAPELLDKLAKTISVGDGEAATADLRLITLDDLQAADLR